MKHIHTTLLLFSVLMALLFASCTNDNLTPLYQEQEEGKIIIRGYNALQDSIQIVANGKPLNINKKDAFVGKISTDYAFVYYNYAVEQINIINKATGAILNSYDFTNQKPQDTLSFYVKEGIWIDNVIDFKPGILSATGKTGYKFIFPTMNRFSKSGYEGSLDAIIKSLNGVVLGKAENITKESFSTYVEFNYAPPPIVNVELVKHGTTESYRTGQSVIVQLSIQNNKSRLIVLDEKANTDGSFKNVEGTINLVDYFTY